MFIIFIIVKIANNLNNKIVDFWFLGVNNDTKKYTMQYPQQM